ncbi:hypothetical protein FA13DRAFT_1792734 [Coprinellus micaceus]|uniref:Uncharacterized protein n=1 Tax=Coprinellus micaceus TaxID=71717 RepID=A0A4Y7T6I7_COPMI|nr:hypothetical protein FA13DRAFT_1792734 [Coprinellus micaceus]
MNPSRSALLQHIVSRISAKEKARLTESGFSGPPPVLYWNTPSYLPFADESVGDGTVSAYPARIIPSPPDDADECAGIALCSAILRADNYEAEIKKVATALCDRVIVGSRLDPGAIADVLWATRYQICQKVTLAHGGEESKTIEGVKQAFVEGVALAAQDLCLDQWEDSMNGEVDFNVLRNVSTFYARLRCMGFVTNEDFDKALGVILEECTETNLALLIVAVVDLISPATMSSSRRPIAAENWIAAQQQLNEIEGRAHDIRGRQVEEDIVALLCGVIPSGDIDLKDIDDTFSTSSTSGDADFEIYLDTIYDLRYFLTLLQDADEAPSPGRYTTTLPSVSYCTDPPPLGTRKWRYLKTLCKDIQKWAASANGLSDHVNWSPMLETLQLEAECEVVDPDTEIHERGIDYGQWVAFHRTLDILEGYDSEEEVDGGNFEDEQEKEEVPEVHVEGGCGHCRKCRDEQRASGNLMTERCRSAFSILGATTNLQRN